MVESAFEFAEVCRKNDYHNFLFSMKASNPLVMVQVGRRVGVVGVYLYVFSPTPPLQRHTIPNLTKHPQPHNPSSVLALLPQAYRLLAAEMYKKGWDYPLHLGVTEAGEGEDGRMKSAIGAWCKRGRLIDRFGGLIDRLIGWLIDWLVDLLYVYVCVGRRPFAIGTRHGPPQPTNLNPSPDPSVKPHSPPGIGSLLMDGLGDTIRVSLTEDPEYELAPCR